MRTIITALVVGLVAGLLAWWLTRATPEVTPAGSAGTTVTAREERPTPRPAPSVVFASSRAPGLIAQVTRDGVPEAEAQVELARAVRALTGDRLEWVRVGVERTGADGRAQFPVASGPVVLLATAQDGRSAVAHVDVAAADTSTEISLALVAPVVVSGRVVEEGTGQPVPDARLRLDPVDGERAASNVLHSLHDRADALGRFSMQVPAGRWELWGAGTAHGSGRLDVTAPATELKLELPIAVPLEGDVVDAQGQRVPGAQVRVAPDDVGTVRVTPEGHYAVVARVGPVSLHALAPDGRQGFARVTLKADGPPARQNLVVADGTSLTGVVREARGPVAGAEVRVLAEPDGLEVAHFDSGPDGRFEAKRLPPGRYSVVAQLGEGRRASVVGVELPGAAPVELVLPDAGRLAGVVRDENGQPVPHAFVWLEWNDALHEVRRSARTGEDGRFTFDELPAAEATVQARVHEAVSEEVTRYVGPGATVEVALTVGAQGRLVVRVGPGITAVRVRAAGGGGHFVPLEGAAPQFEKTLPPGVWTVFGVQDDGSGMKAFVQNAEADVRAGEVTMVTLGSVDGAAAERPYRLHDELGSGLSFENAAGGVRVDFLMSDCPAAQAGARVGDLVISLDGAPVRDALDAFARVRKPIGSTIELVVRRDGQDVALSLK